MTFRSNTNEWRWAYTKGELCFHNSWIFCLENNFANALTNIKAIIGLAFLHAMISFCAWLWRSLRIETVFEIRSCACVPYEKSSITSASKEEYIEVLLLTPTESKTGGSIAILHKY